MMREKDYENIAEIISTTSGISRGSRNNMCSRLADYFEGEWEEYYEKFQCAPIYSKFKKKIRQQFLKRCGLG